MLTIGSNELGEELTDTIKCAMCGEQHPIEYGDEVLSDGTRIPSKLLAVYRCGGKAYLAGVAGRYIQAEPRGKK